MKEIQKKYITGNTKRAINTYVKQINKKTKKPHTFKILGKTFLAYPTVFSPKYFKDPLFFVKNIPVTKGEDFLEIGPATGITSIFAAKRGARTVTAIDINPAAVKNTTYNAKLHKVNIRVLQGDVFSPLKKGEKFDTIYWNTPWGLVTDKKLSYLKMALWDSEYKSTAVFLKDARKYLKPAGRVIIGFSSTIGDMAFLKLLLKKYKYKIKILSEEESTAVNFYAKFELIEAKPSSTRSK